MADLDAFELRLQSAVRRYLEDAPAEVDAAVVVRRAVAGAPRRHILPDLRVFRLAPAWAWLLIVTLLVLAGLAVLVAGAAPDRHLPALVPPVTSATQCPAGSTPDQPGPADQARPFSEPLRMVFDRSAGRIVALVPDDAGAVWTTWTFDVCSNTWTRAGAAGEPSPAPGEWRRPNPVYDADAGVTIALDSDGDAPLVYDSRVNGWTEKGPSPDLGMSPPRSVYDPVSGLVYIQRISSGDSGAPPQDLWTYDVETDTWTLVQQTGDVPPGISGDHLLLAYDSAADRVVAVQSHMNRPGAWELDPRTGEWARSTGAAPSFNTGYVGSGGEIAYDEAQQRTIVFSDGLVAAYDAATDEWETLWVGPRVDGLHTGPQARHGHWMVYDPLNERLVVAGGQYRTGDPVTWVRTDDVWAFHTATRTWTELVAPTRLEAFDDTAQTWVEVEGAVASPTPSG